MTLLYPPFRFVDPGPLVDGELELVPPQLRWADELLTSCRHPLTVERMPREATLSRDDIDRFLSEAPWGRFPGDSSTGRAPAYHYWMLLRHAPGTPGVPPPLRIAGGLSLRVGSTPAVEMYYGHLGYHVYPAVRGHGYALRAARLALPILRSHGFRYAWITCDPGNAASRRTIERLGATYVQTVDVPTSDPLHERGEVIKERFLLPL